MKNIQIHLLVILILSQIYVNFTILNIHYLFALLAICLFGFLNGLYQSFKTDKHIQPDPNEDALLISDNYLLSYKFYSDLIFYINNFNFSNNNPKSSFNENRLSTGNDDNVSSFISKNSDYDDYELDELINENNDIENNFFSRSHTISTNLVDDSILKEEENETESNSKIDLLLDDILNLIVKDFIMVFLNDFFWDKEKFNSSIKYHLFFFNKVRIYY